MSKDTKHKVHLTFQSISLDLFEITAVYDTDTDSLFVNLYFNRKVVINKELSFSEEIAKEKLKQLINPTY